MPFRIWYSDGSAIGGDSLAEWVAAPSSGVQLIYVTEGFDPHGRRLGRWLAGSDHYWFDQGQVAESGDSATRPGKWAQYDAPPGASVKTGAWVSDTAFAEMAKLAGVWACG